MIARGLKIIGVIPARYASVRFPGKALAKIDGKTMIRHVYERAKGAKILSDIIVATDDKRIVDEVLSFKGKAVMTREHASGTDRIAEAVKNTDVDVVVNIQGDEPLMEPEMITRVINPFLDDSSVVMSTLAAEITDALDLCNQNIVKIVLDKDDFALYFSRAPIPYPRETMEKSKKTEIPVRFLKHIGIYAYTKKFLLDFTKLPVSKLEKAEKLEQLRALENGYKIKVLVTEHESVPVDVPDDVKKVEQLVRKGKK